jgi:hypothetical protein
LLQQRDGNCNSPTAQVVIFKNGEQLQSQSGPR